MSGGGEMGALMRAHDWSTTRLGPPETWPAGLRTAVRLLLNSHHPMHIFWGPDAIFFYNDGFVPSAGPERHPASLGRPASASWGEIWPIIGSEVDKVRASGAPTWYEHQHVPILRDGRLEDAYWTYGFSPIDDDSAPGGIGGVISILRETTQTKQLEDELRSSNKQLERRIAQSTREQERLASMFEQAPGFMTMLRGPEHIFELTNAAYSQLIGHRDVVGKPVRQVLPEVEGQGYFELLDNVYATGKPFVGRAMAVELQRTPGAPVERRFIDLVYQPITDAKGDVTGIFVEGYDVTDQVMALTELRESEERNRRIVEGVRDHSIFTTDVDGRILDWTPGAEAIFGWPAEAIKGQSSDLLFTPEDSEAGVPSRELATAREEGCAVGERWHLRRDGSRFFANGSVRPLHDAGGEITGFIKIARDETERREAVQKLALSQEQLRLATDVGEIGEWDVDNLTGAMFWPPRVKAMFGISPDVPVTLDDFHNGVHPEDREKTREAYEAASDPDLRSFYNVEYRTVGREDGLIRWVAAKGRGLFDADGICFRVIGTAIDVTERKRAEERLRELNETLETRVAERTAELLQTEEALRQSQKLEAIGQLTGGVAHDFNNLLTVIRGSVELLRRPDVSEERRARYINAIAETSERATKLTSQLLAFARRQALKPEIFDPSASVGSLRDMMSTLTGSRINIEAQLQCESCWINADPSQFDTALVNMTVNARDAMNGEGELTIEVKPVSGIPAIRSHPPIDGNFVAVSLTDTGTGIPSDKLERIFEPFFTTKGVGAGTGLGLSQVFGFAKQSGGEVEVLSELGHGSTFTIYLPRVSAPAAASEVKDEPLIDGQGACVLVVEDNVDVGAFATQALSELGYVIVLAASAEAALVELEKDAARFDAVFSDVVMAGMDGVELGHEIRRLHPGLPVLLTSGYSHVLSQNGDHGFELLHKPYSIEELSRVLRKIAAWRRNQRVPGESTRAETDERALT